MPTKTCVNCGFAALGQPTCPVIGSPIAPTASACPYWTKELTYCGKCNQIIPNKNHTITQKPDGNWCAICEKCLQLSGTCAGCEKAQVCDFETNPSTIPKAVQKTIQQGPMTSVVTIKNPTRIEMTCRVNCDCWDAENSICLKEAGCCGKYKERF